MKYLDKLEDFLKETPKNLRKCYKCNESFPATLEFFHRSKNRALGLDYICKTCKKEYSKILNRKRRYSLSESQYDEILEKQKGRCDICKKKISLCKKPCVDHDHKNGNVRGILCNNCNTILGLSEDNPLIIIKAIKYLKENKKRRKKLFDTTKKMF